MVIVLWGMAQLYAVDRNGITYIGKGDGSRGDPLTLADCVTVLTRDLVDSDFTENDFVERAKKAYVQSEREKEVRIEGLDRVIHFISIEV